MEMNSGYHTEPMVGIGIPQHTSSPIYQGTPFIANIHHGNNSVHPAPPPLSKCANNFESPKLPLSNHLENHPALYNSRQNTYSNQSHITLPTKPCIDPTDGNNYFHFTSSTHPSGK